MRRKPLFPWLLYRKLVSCVDLVFGQSRWFWSQFSTWQTFNCFRITGESVIEHCRYHVLSSDAVVSPIFCVGCRLICTFASPFSLSLATFAEMEEKKINKQRTNTLFIHFAFCYFFFEVVFFACFPSCHQTSVGAPERCVQKQAVKINGIEYCNLVGVQCASLRWPLAFSVDLSSWIYVVFTWVVVRVEALKCPCVFVCILDVIRAACNWMRTNTPDRIRCCFFFPTIMAFGMFLSCFVFFMLFFLLSSRVHRVVRRARRGDSSGTRSHSNTHTRALSLTANGIAIGRIHLFVYLVRVRARVCVCVRVCFPKHEYKMHKYGSVATNPPQCGNISLTWIVGSAMLPLPSRDIRCVCVCVWYSSQMILRCVEQISLKVESLGGGGTTAPFRHTLCITHGAKWTSKKHIFFFSVNIQNFMLDTLLGKVAWHFFAPKTWVENVIH